jgi:hypothetical protein
MNKAIAELITQSEESIRAAVAINGVLKEFDEESWELFKGSILDKVKKELPQAALFDDDYEEGWWAIRVPLLSGRYDLYVNYNWKSMGIWLAGDKANPAIEKKLAAKMSEITRCDDARWGNAVWGTEITHYPGMENVDDAYYKYDLYRQYAKDPDGVARHIVSTAQALEEAAGLV